MVAATVAAAVAVVVFLLSGDAVWGEESNLLPATHAQSQ
jgi:hypothetical protein